MDLKKHIRSIPDYPKKGILFRDITTLIKNPEAFKYTNDKIVELSKKLDFDKVSAIESRGFVFASTISYILNKPFILLRKKNKLPAETHSVVLENPDLITKAVLGRGLDAQTAFEIVSIDIADVNVGENIGARLQADQAEADTRVARAKAEQRRAEAIATEQEMKAKVVDNSAKLILAEAEVPKAMAQAFREGNI